MTVRVLAGGGKRDGWGWAGYGGRVVGEVGAVMVTGLSADLFNHRSIYVRYADPNPS